MNHRFCPQLGKLNNIQ